MSVRAKLITVELIQKISYNGMFYDSCKTLCRLRFVKCFTVIIQPELTRKYLKFF